jgi:putative ABC transport system ATP-binding protein
MPALNLPTPHLPKWLSPTLVSGAAVGRSGANAATAVAAPAQEGHLEPLSQPPAGLAAAPQPVAELIGVHRVYRLDSLEVPVIRGVDVLIRPGLFTVLMGPSGSGKTTLLNMLGCIDRPDQGEVRVAGQAIGGLSDDALADFRAKNVGFIFQNFNLLPVLSAYENIEYPLLLAGASARTRADRVPKLLRAVGLEDRARNLPGQLSGGQRQRVAIARALATKPKLVIADEPTANLDSKTGAQILSLMRRMQRRYAISFVFSSHDRAVMQAADDAIFIKDGLIHGVKRLAQPHPQPQPE